MEHTVDVMLIENRVGVGDHAVAMLEEAGHRVHRCHEAGAPAFPCRGVTDPATCPISEGARVALLVRHGVHPRPTAYEQGVLCALRNRVPVVEDGPVVLDPFDPWLADRTGDDLVGACVSAADRRLDPLREAVAASTAPVLQAAAGSAGRVSWDVVLGDGGVHLVATGPELDARARSRLAVRALDAARALVPPHSWVDVSYASTSD